MRISPFQKVECLTLAAHIALVTSKERLTRLIYQQFQWISQVYPSMDPETFPGNQSTFPTRNNYGHMAHLYPVGVRKPKEVPEKPKQISRFSAEYVHDTTLKTPTNGITVVNMILY